MRVSLVRSAPSSLTLGFHRKQVLKAYIRKFSVRITSIFRQH